MSQISLTFPDGNSRQYPAGVTAAEVAASIAPSLAKAAISAQLDGAHYDLAWPITADAAISINTMKDAAPALELIRHDLAHIMARAVQEIWPDVKVTIGPVRDYGWFYDFDREEPFTPEDLGAIEAKMKQIIAARDPEAYPNPHEADLDRKEAMLAFASGPHLCLGLHLARREIRIALESFLNRFDDIHIPEGAQYTYHAGSTFNVDSLPIAWTRKS